MSWNLEGIQKAVERTTICLYGDTGDGKTTLLGEKAEHDYIRTYDKRARRGKVMRLYTADPGGYRSIVPYVKEGIIEIVDLVGMPLPWEWVKHTTMGLVPAIGSTPWIRDPERDQWTASCAFEGGTAFADNLMQDAAEQATMGRNIGGEPPAFKYASGDGAMEVKWAGNSRSHYGSVQTIMNIAIQHTLNRLQWCDIVWTFMARRAQDADTGNPILGPEMAGKALTSGLPRLFNYCFRAMAVAQDELTGKRAEHRLYFDDINETMSPGTKTLGNLRLPMDSAEDTSIPSFIQPASLVQAIALWNQETEKAQQKIAARVAAATAA